MKYCIRSSSQSENESEEIRMHLPRMINVRGIRVLTTKQIAKGYDVKEQQIQQNFKNNRDKFVDGRHYISLSGDELKVFKNHFEKIEVVDGRASHLYLWTEKGALLHAKSLNGVRNCYPE